MKSKLAMVALATVWPLIALANDAPVSISPSAIGGEPKIESKSMSGGKMWQMKWRKDSDDRTLILVVVTASAGKRATIKGDIDDLFQVAFKEGLTEDKAEADVREEGNGELDIWDGEADWILGSELAERNPDFSLGDVSSKAPRGPQRNYCVVFTWLSDDKSKSMGGAYCTVLPVGQSTTAEAMLKSLSLNFN